MFNREQMVAEIAKEVVSRLQAQMNGTANGGAAQSAPVRLQRATTASSRQWMRR